MRNFGKCLARILAPAGFAARLAAQSPLIWFCPLDPRLRPEVGYGGSPQYMELFAADARASFPSDANLWPAAAEITLAEDSH